MENSMIFKEEYIEDVNDEFKVEHLVLLYNGRKLIISRTHSDPEEGEEDMWNYTEVEIFSYDGDNPLTDEEEEVVINRFYDGDYDIE